MPRRRAAPLAVRTAPPAPGPVQSIRLHPLILAWAGEGLDLRRVRIAEVADGIATAVTICNQRVR